MMCPSIGGNSLLVPGLVSVELDPAFYSYQV